MEKFIKISTIIFIIQIASLFITSCSGEDVKCSPKTFGAESVVCVCNETYCDTIQALPRLAVGNYWQVTSNYAGLRFEKTQATVNAHPIEASNDSITLTLDHKKVYQTIYGFGGAFTDAAALNIMNLTNATRQKLMNSYFSTDGIEYTFGRVNIGGCDFSSRQYTYDDDQDGDFNLSYFGLADEDLNYKIPLIQQAQQMSNRSITMFASAWSAPAWMKTNNQLYGKGELRGVPGEEYYQAWALYYVKFLQEYQKHGINFWAITAQNEPLDGEIEDFSFTCMGFTAITQRIFIETNLGPTLADNGFSDVKIMMLDDQRVLLPQWAQEVLRNDSNAKDYVDGIAFHWYMNFLVMPKVLDQTHALFPNKFILATEACEGSLPWDPAVVLGSWKRGENYALDIILDLTHWTVGWVDWNLALNMEGGPNWAHNEVDSAIIINHDNGEFYKQPMFYVLGHFSKFVTPGCVVIDTQSSEPDSTDIYQISFDCPDNGSTVVVVLNRDIQSRNVTIIDAKIGNISAEISEQSITTFVWWSN